MSKINEQPSVKCPECGAQIDVNDILYRQVEADVERSLRESMEKEVRDEYSEESKSMREELDQKNHELKDFHKMKAELARAEREKDELRTKIEADEEQKFNKKLREERMKIQKDEASRVELKMQEQGALISSLNKQLEDAQRGIAQGPTQRQGEAQELAIEKWLTESFPSDEVAEIQKGMRGADCLHVVKTTTGQNCGSIYYESKRTKNFQPKWIDKFKKDLREKKANVGVMVTETMPRGMDRMGLREGIWICSFEEFKGLCAVLRESVIQISQSMVAQENKADKMSLLYNYLTSNEFKFQIEAIVEGFTQMQNDLNAEQRAMERLWEKRGKQIDKILTNTIRMYSSVEGIAGSVVPSIPQLEFPLGNEASSPRSPKGRRRP